MMLHPQNVSTLLKDQVTGQQQGEMNANQEATGKAVRPGTHVREDIQDRSFWKREMAPDS